MNNNKMTDITNIIETDSGIDEGYRQKSKQVTPHQSFSASSIVLKWYDINSENKQIPDEIAQTARNFLTKTDFEARGLGFVLLHRCGEDFYFLIVCTWRNSNELWETVFYKNGNAMTDFAIFPRDGVHKPTLCVWELVPVWHEKRAWENFLTSPRDKTAQQNWLNDCFSGLA